MPTAQKGPYRYPALISCIAEGREPLRHELKRVAARIRDEAFKDAIERSTDKFALYRMVWRAADTAVNGRPQTDR